MIYYFLLLLIQLESILWLAASSNISVRDPPIAKPHCADHCGEVLIPYPFGIGDANCYANAYYEIICKTSFNPPKPFLPKYNLEVTDITWNVLINTDTDFFAFVANQQTITVRTIPQNICSSATYPNDSIDLAGSPFSFSSENLLVVEGCSGSVVLRDKSGEIMTGCVSVCPNRRKRNATFDGNKNCSSLFGVGCCQVGSPTDTGQGRMVFYKIGLFGDAATNPHACNMIAAFAKLDSEDSSFSQRLSSMEPVPTVLEWTATFQLPEEKYALCRSERISYCFCEDTINDAERNPYLPYPYGCKVVMGCKDCNDKSPKSPLLKMGLVIGFSTGVGCLLLFICSFWLYKVVKRILEIRRKAKFFERNGGLLLEQQMSSKEGVVEKTKIFAVTELEKATDNFNENRILGQGGQGTVYKGITEDGKLVAIKKSKKVDESQLEQFINEVVLLTQINHRNVVKILGCCLETEVPLLVYEFVLNGTLYELIQAPSEEFQVSWKMRLQIAAESAGALAYLHSSSSTPIYHRDIKSTNILLDDKYRAKISDFGTSKAITIEQTHVTTCVQGTYGYLDPEYFQSNQFTEKSDVYSFGVVLVELITGKKPICPTKSGGWISLASEFLFHMESCTLNDILDSRVFEEGKREEFMAVAKLARECLKMNGKRRPTMKEVAKVLDEIRSEPVHNSAQTNHAEMNEMQRSHFSASMSLTDIGIANGFSIDEQPLIVARTL